MKKKTLFLLLGASLISAAAVNVTNVLSSNSAKKTMWANVNALASGESSTTKYPNYKNVAKYEVVRQGGGGGEITHEEYLALKAAGYVEIVGVYYSNDCKSSNRDTCYESMRIAPPQTLYPTQGGN